MPDCDGFFDAENIPFEPQFQDAAVYAVWSADFFDPAYKKWLILCWFDTTYGTWNGNRYDLRNSRSEMSAWLKANGYATFEAFLEDEHAKNQSKRFRPIGRQV